MIYDPSPLEPVGDNWIRSTIDPIPIGEVHGTITSASTDERIQHRIQIWLTETVGSGEESQIGRNDGLLKTIMCVAGITEFLRNKKTDTTAAKRPDFTALFGGVPVLIDEEKDGDNVSGAVDDIINKFSWIPNLHKLPFFIGIAFSFNQVRFVQLTRNAPPRVIFSHALGSLGDKLAILQPAINVARVLKYFIGSDMIAPAGLSMGKWHTRPCGKLIKLSLQGVEVKCEQPKYGLLKAFYDKCKNILHLERLIDADNRLGKLTLGPLGLSVEPTTPFQLRQAVKCVAVALFGMHECGYVHTDIRWANVVLLENNDWMLIDCYDVCKLDDENGLRERATSRKVMDRPWSSRDDLCQLARLCTEFDFAPKLFVDSLSALVVSANITLQDVVNLCDG